MLEKTLESPLNCKEIKPVYPKKKSVLIFSVSKGLIVKLKHQYLAT